MITRKFLLLVMIIIIISNVVIANNIVDSNVASAANEFEILNHHSPTHHGDSNNNNNLEIPTNMASNIKYSVCALLVVVGCFSVWQEQIVLLIGCAVAGVTLHWSDNDPGKNNTSIPFSCAGRQVGELNDFLMSNKRNNSR
jgi:hypothetical protein